MRLAVESAGGAGGVTGGIEQGVGVEGGQALVEQVVVEGRGGPSRRASAKAWDLADCGLGAPSACSGLPTTMTSTWCWRMKRAMDFEVGARGWCDGG